MTSVVPMSLDTAPVHCIALCVSCGQLTSGSKGLKDGDTLEEIGLKDGGVLYFKDLGMQIGWTTVRDHHLWSS